MKTNAGSSKTTAQQQKSSKRREIPMERDAQKLTQFGGTEFWLMCLRMRIKCIAQ